MTNVVEDIIKLATKYERKEGKTISASQLNSELLQIYYSLTIPEERRNLFKVSASSLGSLVHLGLEKAIERYNKIIPDEEANHLYSEIELEMELANDWKLTGTADLVEILDDKIVIHDFKVVKQYAIKKLKESMKKVKHNENYIIQLNAYRLMYENTMKLDTRPVEMVLDVFYKDTSLIKGEPEYEVVHIPKIDNSIILDMVNEKIEQLEHYLSNNTEPEGCNDTWIRKQKDGSIVHMKCAYYCDFSNICSHYKKLRRGKTSFEDTLIW